MYVYIDVHVLYMYVSLNTDNLVIALFLLGISIQAGSPQLAPASQKDKEPEIENEPQKNTTIHVAGTDVALREKVLQKSLSNTLTVGDSKQGLSMFHNRTKVECMGACMLGVRPLMKILKQPYHYTFSISQTIFPVLFFSPLLPSCHSSVLHG